MNIAKHSAACTASAQRAKSLAWWVMALLSWAVALWSAIRYGALDAQQFFPEQREIYLDHLATLHTHTMYASLALLIGPLQFHENLRRRLPRVHRAVGFVYFIAVAMGGLSGAALSFSAFGAWRTRLGFAVLAVLWLATAAAALYHVNRGDRAAHRRAAIRNFALTFSAVTLRTWVTLLPLFSGMTFAAAYATAAWLSWIPNLIVAELVAGKTAIRPVSTA